jgi:HD-like signal output (HDOD) protein
MNAAQSLDAIDLLIARIGQLHASPTIARKILTLTRSAEFDVAEVAASLEHDPALAARVLRVVNSSRYGLRHRVSSIKLAANFLGQRSLRLFAVTFAVVDALTKNRRGRLYSDYWQRALATATAASRLAKTQAEVDADDAYTVGLLADVGVLMLAQLEGERYEPLYNCCADGFELLALERGEFGFGHPLLGARLLENWGLPASIVEAVAAHHDRPDRSDRSDGHERAAGLILTVQAADRLATAFLVPNRLNLTGTARFFLDHLGIAPRELLAFARTCVPEITETAREFGGRELPHKVLRHFTERLGRWSDSASLPRPSQSAH